MKMPTKHEAMLMGVADALGEKLLSQITFVGGVTVSLHLDDAQPIDIRSTMDVDFIVSVTSYFDYQKLSDELKSVGFKEYIPQSDETAPLCRFICNGIIVDVMPDDASVLGFSNEWFKPSQADPIDYTLPNNVTIRLIKAKYLLATKLAAFFDRGIDMLESKDAEDISVLINGRDVLVDEVYEGPKELIAYIQSEMSRFIGDGNFEYLLSNSLNGEEAERVDIVLDRFNFLAGR